MEITEDRYKRYKRIAEEVNKLLEKQKKEKKREKKIQYIGLAFGIVGSLLSGVFAIISLTTVEENATYVYDKNTIQKSIKTIITNGGNLEDIKHEYNKREFKRNSFFIQNKENYYPKDYPLIDILRDLRNNFFIEQEEKKIAHSYSVKNVKDSCLIDRDSLYFTLLNRIIAENIKKNPFDKLEENQKYNFVNIQEKLDSNYYKISGDVIKIVDELSNKNQLVTKYLNKSDLSLGISIAAFFFAIIIAIYQFYLNKKSSKKLEEIISKVCDQYSDKNDDSKD